MIHSTSCDLRWALLNWPSVPFAAMLERAGSASLSGAAVSPEGPVWQAVPPC